jgi:hypothetical protein
MNAKRSIAARAQRAARLVATAEEIRLDRILRSATLDGVGVTTWFYLRRRPGELRPLARSKVEDFFFRAGRLPVDEHGLVRYAEVVVYLEDRHAVEVIRLAYFQARAHADGTLDREHDMELMSAAAETAVGAALRPKPPVGVISAEHRFARRRLDRLGRWTPTKVEIHLLRQLVNRRTRRDILS